MGLTSTVAPVMCRLSRVIEQVFSEYVGLAAAVVLLAQVSTAASLESLCPFRGVASGRSRQARWTPL